MTAEHCPEHSGCLTDISNLKEWKVEASGSIKCMDKKLDTIQNRITGVFASIAVAALLLLINALVEFVKH